MKNRNSMMAVVILLLFVSTAAFATGTERYTWNGPYQVTTTAGQTYGFDPAMVLTTGGTYFALMAGTVNGSGGMYLISSSDGMNWGSPTFVTSGWDDCDIIQGQDGYLYAAISTGGGVQVWRGSSSGTGWSKWGQVVSIGGGQQYWAGSLTQAPDGTFYCAFMDHDGVSHHVYVSSSSDAASWSSKILVPGPGTQHYFDPSIEEIGGVLFVAYNAYYNYEMWMSKSYDGGATWSTPTQVTSGAGTTAFCGPSLAMGPGGNLVMAYGTVSNGLCICESETGGAAWTSVQVQSKGSGPSMVRASDGKLWIIYAEVVGSEWEIFTTCATVSEPLYADTYALSESAGGVINFTIDAGAGNANRNYLLLGSVTGTSPGTLLPGGMATLPLNWDPFTDFVMLLLNTPVFSNFLGKLDGSGQASAQFNTFGPLPSGLVGVVANFAYTLNNPFDYASNPVSVYLIP